MFEKIKQCFLALQKVWRQPDFLAKLEIENVQLQKRVEGLQRTKEGLMEELADHGLEISELEEDIKRSEALTEKGYEEECEIFKNVSKQVETIGQRLVDSMLTSENAKEIYDILRPLDPEGWQLNKCVESILRVDVCREFYTEDNLGYFEEADGHELKDYAEIARFGECEYDLLPGGYEKLASYKIDFESQEYKEYEKKLWPQAIRRTLAQEMLYEGPSIENIPRMLSVLDRLLEYKENPEAVREQMQLNEERQESAQQQDAEQEEEDELEM